MMDPWTVGGLVGVFNGLVGVGNSRDLQQKQMAMQVAIQNRQIVETARLQKELKKLSLAESAEARKQNFEHQCLMAKEKRIQEAWPLKSLTIDHFVRKFAQYADSEDGIPLQLIIAQSSTMRVVGLDLASIFKNSIDNFVNYVSEHYSMNKKDAPVELYTAAQSLSLNEIRTLHDVLMGIPTIILQPRCDNVDFVLEVALWGIGRTTQVQTREVYRCNMQEVFYEVLDRAVLNWKKVRATGVVPPNEQWDALSSLLEEEKKKIAVAKQSGLSETDIDKFIRQNYRSKYDAYSRLLSVELYNAYSDMVRSSCKVVGTLVADSYYLLIKGRTPMFPPGLCWDC